MAVIPTLKHYQLKFSMRPSDSSLSPSFPPPTIFSLNNQENYNQCVSPQQTFIDESLKKNFCTTFAWNTMILNTTPLKHCSDLCDLQVLIALSG